MQEVVWILALFHVDVDQFLLEFPSSGIAEGVVLLLERLPCLLYVSKSVFRLLAVVMLLQLQCLPRVSLVQR